MTATAAEGSGSVHPSEVDAAYDLTDWPRPHKVRIDPDRNFPDEGPRSRPSRSCSSADEVIRWPFTESREPKTLKESGEFIRDAAQTQRARGISQVDIKGIAEFEVSVNVSESAYAASG